MGEVGPDEQPAVRRQTVVEQLVLIETVGDDGEVAFERRIEIAVSSGEGMARRAGASTTTSHSGIATRRCSTSCIRVDPSGKISSRGRNGLVITRARVWREPHGFASVDRECIHETPGRWLGVVRADADERETYRVDVARCWFP